MRLWTILAGLAVAGAWATGAFVPDEAVPKKETGGRPAPAGFKDMAGDAKAAERVKESHQTEAAHTNNRIGEMVTIPAGSFLMGNNGSEGAGGPEEFPRHPVNLPAYQIGKYEVTRGEYRKFIESGGYKDSRYWSTEGWKWKEKARRSEPDHWAAAQNWGGNDFRQTDNHPVVGVTYYEAEAYCRWAGGRVPTEAEWEKAARWTGTHSNVYPWGDAWDPEKCNNLEDHSAAGGGYKKLQSAPVGSYPDGASPYGCMDMVGNAYEWVSDWSKSYPGSSKPFDNTPKTRFVRGGCWDDGPSSVRCAYRGWSLPPDSSGTGPGDTDYIGFRVAR
ncbi:MAG: SUMF1/EgtB/PvdO family nonheme iron enzyme [Planctomycetota bacterium]|nr:SUMF1/EgtB/PvdO family nonheme iron enzyme [Planctomycetota bacterium]